MFEKLNIDFAPIKDTEFQFQKNDISVTPFIKFKDRVIFVEEYVNYLFSDSEEDISVRYFIAEQALVAQMVDRCTNVSVENIDFENLIASGLWEQVRTRILNYDDFRKDLESAIEIKKFEKYIEKSVGTILENLSENVSVFLQKISEMDVESLKNSAREFSLKLEELNDNVPGVLKNEASTALSKKTKNKKSVE